MMLHITPLFLERALKCVNEKLCLIELSYYESLIAKKGDSRYFNLKKIQRKNCKKKINFFCSIFQHIL